jgi:hypothetical protein
MNKDKLTSIKTTGYFAATAIIVINIILWITILWSDSNFLSSATYFKILITSFALVALLLIVSGFIGFISEEEKLKKDKLIG